MYYNFYMPSYFDLKWNASYVLLNALGIQTTIRALCLYSFLNEGT